MDKRYVTSEYEIERAIAVACGSPYCLHDWNRLHPDDPITPKQQADFSKQVVQAMKMTGTHE